MIYTISTGTLNERDLSTRFLAEIQTRIKEELFNPEWDQDSLLQCIGEVLSIMDDMRSRDYFESETCLWNLDSMQNILQELAPPGEWFGTVEGDGAHFAYQPIEEND